MKKVIIVLTIASIFLLSNIKNVYAEENKFYEAETIDNIYLIRTDGATKYYQKARFFRRRSDNQPAYCLEPFAVFNEDAPYNNSQMLPSFPSKRDRIREIVRFGYLDKNHTDEKWYAITQMMIWKELYGENNFYFTDTLNGNKIEPYNNEINEINRRIEESKKKPSWDNQTFYIEQGNEISLYDSNQVLDKYVLKSGNGGGITKVNHTLKVKQTSTDKSNIREIKLLKTDHYHNKPVMFYYANNSQAIITTGDLPNTEEAKVKIIFQKLQLNIQKISEKIEHAHETKLQETEFALFNDKDEKITDIKLDENYQATISSDNIKLTYGNYYLKETKAGTGYIVDNKKYPIHFTSDNTTLNLTIENKIVKKEIILKKYLTDKDQKETEENAIFEIYDKKGHLIKTASTNKEGIIKLTLPYGHYIIKQIKGKDGYSIAEKFEIFINDQQKEYIYTIEDKKEEIQEVYEVNVPNTYKEQEINNITFLLLGAGLFYVQKKFY